MPDDEITPEYAEKLSAATVKNIVDKITAGGVPSKREQELLDARRATSVTRLSCEHIAAKFGMNARTMRDILISAKVFSAGGHDVDAAAIAVVAYWRKKAEAHTATLEAERDRARRAKAEADSAELDALQKAGKLCWRSDYDNNFQDGIALGVRNISRLPDLNDAQKESVFEALRAIQWPPLEQET